ncbi:MAG TPA: class I SAM-dependent methyltransferase [Caulobacteraceae bacterium]
MTETILVFPGGLPDALSFRAAAAARGCSVVGASSLGWDAASDVYDAWERLPYVHEDGFAPALADLLRRRRVDAIYAPHGVVAGRLSEILGELSPDTRLIDARPLLDKEQAYRELRARVEALPAGDWFQGSPVEPKPRLSGLELAGLLRLVDTVPGMSDRDKIAAVVEMMRHAPPGDVVEIGSWWGRSAALFVWLARRYGVGPVLCVDPWLSEALPQGVAVLDRASAAHDTDEALRIFEINLAPLAQGGLNYLRTYSAEGAGRYTPGLTVETEAFGATRYSGEIAVLHIDGNHAYERVEEDARLWTPLVKPGGWIIFDDYVWAFGDGPKQVGDAFIEENAERVALSFVIGTALFVQLAA